MRTESNIWQHKAPADCSWYWKKLHSLKGLMESWYQNREYTLTPNGAYSMTKSYNMLLGEQVRMQESGSVWTTMMQPKHLFIIWLANQDRLLTKKRLLRIKIPVANGSCSLCDQGRLETQAHLFAECSWITAPRNGVSIWLGIQLQEKGIRESLHWIQRRNWKQVQKEMVAAVWGAMIYHTWQARNWRIFRNITINREFTIAKIQQEVKIRLDSMRNTCRARKCQYLFTWI
ncbi:PREDICTED: uncharacterized protein LOC109241112 [Nicotiana attenuata]|uniref:uncharacterized protein LOC109241112 n=1 Tax=Nicotiana attenuata TaxID=49451 RepID=UPI0009053881|nr:PREDICTED: uncharacterized protein LOC109241112 [Nicotiana attenuata]